MFNKYLTYPNCIVYVTKNRVNKLGEHAWWITLYIKSSSPDELYKLFRVLFRNYTEKRWLRDRTRQSKTTACVEKLFNRYNIM